MPIDAILVLAAIVSFTGGLVRGFSGFGGALIFVPLISALYDPSRAGPTFFVVDVLLTAPMTWRALKACEWREVMPMGLAAAVMTPLGVWLLAVSDPVALRWAICAVAVAILTLLVSGWRYAGRPRLPATLGVGGLAGILSGAAQLSGAPVAAFWLGGPNAHGTVRANLIAFFAVVSVASGLSFLAAGLFTGDVGRLALWLGPLYGLGLVLGQRRFVGASETGYRRMAYSVIALACVLAAPLWDGFWR